MTTHTIRSARPIGLALGLAAAASLAGCYHATQLSTTWHDRKTPSLEFNKPVAVFISPDQALRRTVEDHLSASYPGAVPSYTVLSSTDEKDPGTILSRLQQEGFDGAIVMRVTDVSTATNYGPGYDGYWGGYGTSWAYPYDPSYMVTDRVVSVETQIYTLTDNRLVFTASSETTNPANAAKLTDSVMRHVMERLRKDGLVK